LPKWVVEEIDRDNDLAYTDQWGRRNYEYISLGCDNLPVLKGRTPVQCYADYMRSVDLGAVLADVDVGTVLLKRMFKKLFYRLHGGVIEK
jgi:hypothetical protein